jgi:hypothetical protein
MKNQYVGDVNDYLKYAYLRALQRARRGSLLVCWMLTPPDKRRDGNKLGYLDQSVRFRPVDPELFDGLQTLVQEGRRSVVDVQELRLLRRASFHSDYLRDDLEPRSAYFERLVSRVKPGALVFFDPDNGLEIASRRKGRRDSAKYLYWDEMVATVSPAVSAVIYQHCPRENRRSFSQRMVGAVQERLLTHRVFALCSSHVLYLVAATRGEYTPLRQGSAEFASRWPSTLVLHGSS